MLFIVTEILIKLIVLFRRIINNFLVLLIGGHLLTLELKSIIFFIRGLIHVINLNILIIKFKLILSWLQMLRINLLLIILRLLIIKIIDLHVIFRKILLLGINL